MQTNRRRRLQQRCCPVPDAIFDRRVALHIRQSYIDMGDREQTSNSVVCHRQRVSRLSIGTAWAFVRLFQDIRLRDGAYFNPFSVCTRVSNGTNDVWSMLLGQRRERALMDGSFAATGKWVEKSATTLSLFMQPSGPGRGKMMCNRIQVNQCVPLSVTTMESFAVSRTPGKRRDAIRPAANS